MQSVAMPIRALPVPRLEMPVRPSWPTILHPTLWHPIIPWAYHDPMPCPPGVPGAFPSPISRCPDVARAWRGNHFDARRRRSNFDIEIEIDSGEGRRTQNCHGTKPNNQVLPHKKPAFVSVDGVGFSRRCNACRFSTLTKMASKSFPRSSTSYRWYEP